MKKAYFQCARYKELASQSRSRECKIRTVRGFFRAQANLKLVSDQSGGIGSCRFVWALPQGFTSRGWRKALRCEGYHGSIASGCAQTACRIGSFSGSVSGGCTRQLRGLRVEGAAATIGSRVLPCQCPEETRELRPWSRLWGFFWESKGLHGGVPRVALIASRKH